MSLEIPTGRRFVLEEEPREIWERVLYRLTGKWPRDRVFKYREVAPDSPEWETAPFEETT